MKRLATLLFCLPFLTALSFSQTFTLSSKDVGGQATMKQVFKGFGCEGENISPQLSWENAPEGTQSFAITMYDKDAPTGSGWWHWLAFDIPASTSSIPSAAGNPAKGLMPSGTIQSMTNYGGAGYGGPCPPEGHGLHQYVLTVYALNVKKLGLDKDINPAIVGYNLNNAAIGKASIVFYYQR